MSDVAESPPRMTVDEFVLWAQTQPGRHELFMGEVVTMQSERIDHARVKFLVSRAIDTALAAGHTDCLVLPDGVTVRIDAETAFEPDVTVHCGPVDFSSLFAANPVVVMEVVSPSSFKLDTTRKFSEYFRLPSIQHYVIVQIKKRIVIHHRRNGDEIVSRILGQGSILQLDPPGIAMAVAEFFAGLPEG